jgi:hypothetical protein
VTTQIPNTEIDGPFFAVTDFLGEVYPDGGGDIDEFSKDQAVDQAGFSNIICPNDEHFCQRSSFGNHGVFIASLAMTLIDSTTTLRDYAEGIARFR